MKDGGIYFQVGGRPVLDILRETAPKAAALAIGSCCGLGGNPVGGGPIHRGQCSTARSSRG